VSVTSLRDRQRIQVRADIRRAAYRLFAERGFDAVTTEEIAAAAGVSPRTFFRHVASKEELLLGPVRHGGAAIASLLDQRPSREPPDVALANAIIGRASAFEDSDTEEWRAALLVAPDLLDKATILATEDKDRLVKLTAVRMGSAASTEFTAALLVHLAFAAGNFAFQQWVRDSAKGHRPLQTYVSEALEAIKHPRWRRSAKS
jgi:AcrR family transcriptional regulator